MDAHAETPTIAVAALGPSLDAPTDPRFGRCACFLLVDAESLAFELLENTVSMHLQGAGIASARLLIEAGVTVVLVRNVGPNALDLLQAAGIAVYGAEEGSVRQALLSWRDGLLGRLRGPRKASTPPSGPPPSGARGPRSVEELRLQQRALRRRLETLEQQIRSLEGDDSPVET